MLLRADFKRYLSGWFSVKSFGQGLCVGAVFFVLMVLWLATQGKQADELLLAKLESRTVTINRGGDIPPNEVASSEIITEASGDTTLEAVQSDIDLIKEIEDTSQIPALITQSDAGEQPRFVIPEQKLREAPIPGLEERNAAGLTLPMISRQDGLTPFNAYRRPMPDIVDDKPIIALAIMDIGLSGTATESAIRTMPPEISFIFSPYTDNPDFWIGKARERGHEVWLSLPIEPENYPFEDTGPHTLLLSETEKDHMMKLEYIMSRAKGYTGFVSSYHPAFMESISDMRAVLGYIYKRGLGFIDGSESVTLAAQNMAAAQKAPFSAVNIWLDRPETDKQSIQERLQQLEIYARENGGAVAVFGVSPISFQEILLWVENVRQEKEFILVPLSATTGM